MTRARTSTAAAAVAAARSVRGKAVAELVVKVVRMPHAEGLALPAYQSDGAAGLDLLAAVGGDSVLTVCPGARALVPTGLKLELPLGFEAQVRPRSGLAYRHGVTVLNAPGTIDRDYRGEVQVLLINHGDQPFSILRGERIAQLVVAPVTRAKLVDVPVVSNTVRGAGGFGSTGRASRAPGSTSKRAKKRSK